jgi:HD-GYP domain-containing protein (c-di-GMP phosphodiesterase class II)
LCGKKILSAVTLFSDVAPIVEAHHERYDGTGYPHGLKGTEIPEEARIIAIADAFDAMTSSRRYRANMSFEQAVDELKLGSGTQFDAEMVACFLEVLRDFDRIREELDWTYSDSKFDETVGNVTK